MRPRPWPRPSRRGEGAAPQDQGMQWLKPAILRENGPAIAWATVATRRPGFRRLCSARPPGCMHACGRTVRKSPHEERSNEAMAYDRIFARNRLLRRTGRWPGTDGDTQEHQGDRRDHAWLS